MGESYVSATTSWQKIDSYGKDGRTLKTGAWTRTCWRRPNEKCCSWDCEIGNDVHLRKWLRAGPGGEGGNVQEAPGDGCHRFARIQLFVVRRHRLETEGQDRTSLVDLKAYTGRHEITLLPPQNFASDTSGAHAPNWYAAADCRASNRHSLANRNTDVRQRKLGRCSGYCIA